MTGSKAERWWLVAGEALLALGFLLLVIECWRRGSATETYPTAWGPATTTTVDGRWQTGAVAAATASGLTMIDAVRRARARGAASRPCGDADRGLGDWTP